MSEEKLTEAIADCKSSDELISLLDRSTAPNGKPFKLAGYGGLVDSHFIRDKVDQVLNGDANINFVTRNYGLRAKVLELIEVDNLINPNRVY